MLDPRECCKVMPVVVAGMVISVNSDTMDNEDLRSSNNHRVLRSEFLSNVVEAALGFRKSTR